MIETLAKLGFVLEVKYFGETFQVRILTKNGFVKIGYGSTFEEALVNGMTFLVESIENEVLQAERKVNEMESYLHNHGFIFNMLDDEEMERYNARNAKPSTD